MRSPVLLALALIALSPLSAQTPKLTDQDKIELIRGLTAEYAKAKVEIPRSKKALAVESDGAYNTKTWEEAQKKYGPAARSGDQVQVTAIELGGDRIIFQINGGFDSGRGKWYQHIQIGLGNSTAPVARNRTASPHGTSIELLFHKPIPVMTSAEVKKLLAPVLDFEKHSVTENFIDSLPPEMKQAVKEKRALAGMDKDTVLLALGRPVRKIRETTDTGGETEDWVYGTPPGKIVFVTFQGDKAIKVKETYAGLGTEAPNPPTPR